MKRTCYFRLLRVWCTRVGLRSALAEEILNLEVLQKLDAKGDASTTTAPAAAAPSQLVLRRSKEQPTRAAAKRKRKESGED